MFLAVCDDVREALRRVRRNPRLTLLAVGTLAVGIGAASRRREGRIGVGPSHGLAAHWRQFRRGRARVAAGRTRPMAHQLGASPGYFATMGIPILAGPGVTDGDGPSSEPVAIVNDFFAETFWDRPRSGG
jgi:hypothetical protein